MPSKPRKLSTAIDRALAMSGAETFDGVPHLVGAERGAGHGAAGQGDDRDDDEDRATNTSSISRNTRFATLSDEHRAG